MDTLGVSRLLRWRMREYVHQSSRCTMAFQPIVDISDRGESMATRRWCADLNGESAGVDAVSGSPYETRYAFDQACRVKAIETGGSRLRSRPPAQHQFHAQRGLSRRGLPKASDARRRPASYGFPPELITFEFTEDEQDHRSCEHLMSIVVDLSPLWVSAPRWTISARVSPGLSLLADFQPDVHQDRSLPRIANIDSQRSSRQAIVAGILATARNCSALLVIAEGVERQGRAGDALRGDGRYALPGLFCSPARRSSRLITG